MSDNTKPTKEKITKIIIGATKVIASLSYTKLKVVINMNFGDDYDFSITAFNKYEDDNVSFYFYSFYDLISIRNKLTVLVKTIKSDDFGKIKELAEL